MRTGAPTSALASDVDQTQEAWEGQIVQLAARIKPYLIQAGGVTRLSSDAPQDLVDRYHTAMRLGYAAGWTGSV